MKEAECVRTELTDVLTNLQMRKPCTTLTQSQRQSQRGSVQVSKRNLTNSSSLLCIQLLPDFGNRFFVDNRESIFALFLFLCHDLDSVGT